MQNPNSAIPVTFKTPVRLNPPEESETLIRLDALEAMVQRIAAQTDTPEFFPHIVDEDDEESYEAALISPSFLVGQHVLHRKFGKGTVLEVDGYGISERVKVNFERAGLKLIAQDVAKMQALSK